MRYFTAIRAASIAASKQPDGVDAATTGTGDSEFRPKSTISRSACSGFVGIPVDGPGALDVDDDERELERHREPDRLRLEHDPGPCRRRHAERAAERRAERGSRGGDLVLGLERAHAEVLQLGELLEDVGGRRDRVGAEEERQTGELARRRRARTSSAVLPETCRYVPGSSFAGAISYEPAKSSDVSP